VNNDPEIQTVNWMLEDFPADVKQKCKEQAVSRRQTLKAFVEATLREATGMALPSEDQRGQEPGPAVKPAARSRGKGRQGPIKERSRAS